MLALTGYCALLLAFVLALCCALAAAVAGRRDRPLVLARAEEGLFVVAGLLSVAVAVLLHLLLTRNFQVQYVYAHASTYQPIVYLVSALWAGEEGSLLLWTLLLSLATIVVLILQKRHSTPALWPVALSALSAVQAFFVLLLITVQNPFVLLAANPSEGVGLSPLLENPAMIIHPPILFLGYATYSVPFAMALAALIAGQSPPEWQKWIRRWSLTAWLFLGTGIAIGAWWAYVELGWGGYWSWDPVENASLIPWLIGTAQLHSLMAEERQRVFKRWNAALTIGIFLLCVFATLVTRGGIIISDLHGFAQNIQPVAYYLIGFLALTTVLSGILLHLRREQLRDNAGPEQLLSRESGLFIGSLLFIGLAAAILLGMLFPNLAQSISGTKIYLGTDFYDRVFAPLALVLVALIGICPLLGWTNTSLARLARRLRYPVLGAVCMTVALLLSGIQQPLAVGAFALITFAGLSVLSDPVRQVLTQRRLRGDSTLKAIVGVCRSNRRSYGGKLIHLAILLIAIGLAGSSLYKTEAMAALAPGERATIQGYVVEYEGTQVLDEPGRRRYVAAVDVYQNESLVARLLPEKNLHYSIGQYVTEVAIRGTMSDDLYIALDWPEQDGRATFRLGVYPLVTWLWIGAGLLLFGTLVALWPAPSEIRQVQDVVDAA